MLFFTVIWKTSDIVVQFNLENFRHCDLFYFGKRRDVLLFYTGIWKTSDIVVHFNLGNSEIDHFNLANFRHCGPFQLIVGKNS